MKLSPCRFLFLVLTLGFFLAPAQAQEPEQEKRSDIEHRVTRATVLITRHKAPGQGTGWVVDAKRRLLVTNYHVVGRFSDPSDADSLSDGRSGVYDRVIVTFPDYSFGKLKCERKDYSDDSGTDAGLRAVKLRSDATVIFADESRDLALLQADFLALATPALPLAEREQEAGDPHFTIGHPGNETLLWRIAAGKTILREFEADIGAVKDSDYCTRIACGTVKSTAKTFGGRSGSSVVNPAGEVVAVMSGGDTKGRSRFTDLTELKAFLQEAESYLVARTVPEIQRRGRSYLAQGRLDMAAKDFREVRERRAEMPEMVDEDMLDLAAVTRAQHLFDESLEWCVKALTTKDRAPGRAFAERAATRLAELPHPAFHPVIRKLPKGKALFGKGKDDPEFQKQLAEAQKKRDEFWGPRKQAVLDDVAAALKEDPKLVLAYQTRADLLRRSANPDHEQIIADRTAIVKAKNNALRRDAESLLERARAFHEAGQFDKAIADCDAVFRINRRSPAAIVWQCRNYLAVGRREDARLLAFKLVGTHTDDTGFHEGIEIVNPANHELLARIDVACGNFSEAIQALDVAIKRTKEFKLAEKRRHYVDRGDALVQVKQFAKARADYQQALKTVDPIADNLPDSKEAVAYQRRYSIDAIKQKIKDLP